MTFLRGEIDRKREGESEQTNFCFEYCDLLTHFFFRSKFISKERREKKMADEADPDVVLVRIARFSNRNVTFQRFSNFDIKSTNTQQLQAFREAFNQFDKDGDGHITVQELAVVMMGLNIKVTKAELNDIIQQVDTDNNGTIEFNEFFAIMQAKMASMDPSEMVNIAFDSFDNDGDKAIGPEDLLKVLQDMGETVTQDEVDELIRVADLDRDGKLSQHEFTEWMKTR